MYGKHFISSTKIFGHVLLNHGHVLKAKLHMSGGPDSIHFQLVFNYFFNCCL